LTTMLRHSVAVRLSEFLRLEKDESHRSEEERCSEEEPAMPDHRIFLGELTRKELGAAIADGTIRGAIVPTGACEQHHDHLAMIHDAASVTEIARRVAMQFAPHVLVTPTVAMSVSEHHMSRGGALTIRPDIYVEYVHDVCHSLKRLGVPKVMVLNGHGGNM